MPEYWSLLLPQLTCGGVVLRHWQFPFLQDDLLQRMSAVETAQDCCVRVLKQENATHNRLSSSVEVSVSGPCIPLLCVWVRSLSPSPPHVHACIFPVECESYPLVFQALCSWRHVVEKDVMPVLAHQIAALQKEYVWFFGCAEKEEGEEVEEEEEE